MNNRLHLNQAGSRNAEKESKVNRRLPVYQFLVRWEFACAIPIVLMACGRLHSQTRIYRVLGAEYKEGLGYSVASVGDVNVDGFADFFVGSNAVAQRGAVYSGHLGTPLYSVYPEQVPYWDVYAYPTAAAGVGDTNGDGRPDFVVSDPQYNENSSNQGAVWLYSGLDGTILHVFKGWKKPQSLGTALSLIGDVNEDGRNDILVGADGEPPLSQGGVHVFSGSTYGGMIAIQGDAAQHVAGYDVAGTGDLDGDGKPDFAYGAPGATGGCYVSIRSSATSAEIHRISQFGIGLTVANVGDVDQDGTTDLALFDAAYSVLGSEQGSVRVYSGSNWQTIYEFPGGAAKDRFGHAIDGGNDLNEDGVPDIVATSFPDIATPPGWQQYGYLRAYSGSNGDLLYQINNYGGPIPPSGNLGSEYFGVNVASLGDVNGDGAGDVIAGASWTYNGLVSHVGKFEVYSGVPLPLASNANIVSLASGGTPALRLTAGAAHSNAIYLMLGSFTGTQPGIAVDSMIVPLVWDPYTAWTIASPNQAPLAQSLSLLDGSGTGLTTITIPPGAFNSLVGEHVFHAYVLLEGGGLSFASNAVPLSFLP